MSAYIVKQSTINAIVTFAFGKELHIDPLPGSNHVGSAVPITQYEPKQIAELLWSENHRSVNHRYREQMSLPPFSYAERRSGEVLPAKTRILTPVDIISLCKCLNYQCCEPGDWSGTWTYRFLLEVIASAADDLIDGKDAPWGLYD